MITLKEHLFKGHAKPHVVNIVDEVRRLCKEGYLSDDGVAIVTIPGDYRYDITIEKITDYNENVIKDLSELKNKLLSVENKLKLKQLKFYYDYNITNDKLDELGRNLNEKSLNLVRCNRDDKVLFINCSTINELIDILSNISNLN